MQHAAKISTGPTSFKTHAAFSMQPKLALGQHPLNTAKHSTNPLRNPGNVQSKYIRGRLDHI